MMTSAPRLLSTLGLVALLCALPGRAGACGPEVEIRFFEGDGDLFVIRNLSQEPWALVTLVLSLTGSRGRLVFDTDYGGPGASEPSAFEAVEGPPDKPVGLVGVPAVGDGAEALTLRFRAFLPGREFIFTIDVDDRLEDSDLGQAVVSGAEIAGAAARAMLTSPKGGTTDARGTFGADARARLRGGLCV